MKRSVIALFASLHIFPAIAETPPVVLPENAALLTMVPEDYPTEKESFDDNLDCYAVLLDPSTQDPRPKPFFCSDFPRLSLIYAYHDRKLPKAPIFSRDKDKVEQNRRIFEKMFSAYISSDNSIQNKRWILDHGADVIDLQERGYKWNDTLVFYSFNALFNPELFSQLHAGNASGTLRRSHIPSPMIVLVGETKTKKIIFDWKLIEPFYFFRDGLPVSGDYATG